MPRADRLIAVDHISQSMPYDEMLSWLLFYTGILDLQRLPQMEIADPVGLVQSQALINGNQGLRVILNGSSATRTLSARFINEFFGSGVQHIAFSCTDIFATVADMRARGADFLKIPDNYYDDIEAKYDLDAATMAALRDNQILYDREGDGEFFQIYTHTFDERFFFEIVERRDYHGFGAANAAIRLAAQTRESRPLTPCLQSVTCTTRKRKREVKRCRSREEPASPRRCCWPPAGHLTPALAEPLACDDGIKTAFRPDADTSVVAVRLVKKGEELMAPDAPQPVTAAADLVPREAAGQAPAPRRKRTRPRAPIPKASASRSGCRRTPTGTSASATMAAAAGSAAVIATPTRSAARCRRIVNANIGYASGTTDAGQPWYQDGSFAFLSDGKVNEESLRDFSVRAMVEQAVKTKALVNLYYGKAPKYTYYDGHSQGGRQGMKLVQEYPELYDGYMIAQPALSIAKFGTTALVSPDRDEDRARLHRGEQGGGCGLCRQGRRRQQARGRRLRQGRASVSCSIPSPATTIPRAMPTRCAPAWPAMA